jgi:hypothetical protein
MPGLKRRSGGYLAAAALSLLAALPAQGADLNKVIEDLGKIRVSQYTTKNSLRGVTAPTVSFALTSGQQAQSDKEQAIRRFDADQKLQVEKDLKDMLEH